MSKENNSQRNIVPLPNKRISFLWDLHFMCNYKCSYCAFFGDWDRLAERNLYIPKEKWFAAWDAIYDKYGSVNIHFIGGEPCVYPSFVELASGLSKKHYLGLTTNLSVNFNKFAEQIPPEKVEFGIGASFHPAYADLEVFSAQVLMLKNKGFKIWVNYVAYPPQMEKTLYYKQRFANYEVPFVIQPFRGSYDGENYPESYAQSQRQLIREVAGKDSGMLRDMEYQLERRITKGKLCRAGQVAAHVSPDGIVNRCGDINEPMGSLFDGDFRLFPQPLPCPVEHCPCDYIYLVDEDKNAGESESPGIFNEQAEVIRDLIEESENSLFHSNFVLAEELAKRALSRQKDNDWALRVLARIYREKAELFVSEEKEKYLNLSKCYIDQALSINCSDPWINVEAACTFLAQGKIPEAKEKIDKALNFHPYSEYFQKIKNSIYEARESVPKNRNNKETKSLKVIKIVLVLACGWGRESPPYSLALLSGILRKEGFEVEIFDINNILYHKHDFQDQERQLWNWEQSNFWNDQQLVSGYILKNSKLLDSIVDRIISSGANIIGFSAYISTKLMGLELAKRLKAKKNDLFTIFGGSECRRKAGWEELISKEYVDAIVFDDADESLPDFLGLIRKEGKPAHCPGISYKENGRIIDCGDRLPNNLDSLPFADFSDFDFNSYRCPDNIKISFSRGCTERCVYCSACTVWRGFRTMSGERIFREIKYQLEQYQRRMGKDKMLHIMFLDSLVNGNVNVFKYWITKIAESRKDKSSPFRKLSWSAQITIHPAITVEIVKLAKASGCIELNYGIESGSLKVLQAMKKRYTPENAENVVRAIYKAGVVSKGNFMFGFPTETDDDFNQTLSFIRRNMKFITQIYPSRTFCALEKFTFVRENKALFGIMPQEKEHHLFWESQEGRNNYLVRLERYMKFCNEVLKLSPKSLVTGVDDIERDKWFCLGQYYQYKEDFNEALDCYRKYLELEGVKESVSSSMELCESKARS